MLLRPLYGYYVSSDKAETDEETRIQYILLQAKRPDFHRLVSIRNVVPDTGYVLAA